MDEIKTIGKGSSKKDQLEDKRIIREAAISLLLHHPNIVSMQEIIADSNFYYMFFEVSLVNILFASMWMEDSYLISSLLTGC